MNYWVKYSERNKTIILLTPGDSGRNRPGKLAALAADYLLILRQRNKIKILLRSECTYDII
jgi:hypothetical protein